MSGSRLVVAMVLAGSLPMAHEPVLSARSLYDLHDSADLVKWRLQLSPGEFDALQEALDVLVGDDARRLIERADRSPVPLPPAVLRAAEARVLAPIEGMTFELAVTAAIDKTRVDRAGLQGELRVEKVAAPASRRQLQRIDVVRAAYWSSVATGERSVDFTIRNGSDRTLSALLLDCRLIDTTRRITRERGTCGVEFEGGLAPGMTATVTAPVSWETRHRLGWTVEARPIRARDLDGQPLWEVASEHDPRERGRIAELESRIADLERDLRSLRVDRLAAR